MKTQKSLLNFLQSQGWRIEKTNRHWKLLPPFREGGIVIMSHTTGDHRALNNMIADVRRAYRKIGRESPL